MRGRVLILLTSLLLAVAAAGRAPAAPAPADEPLPTIGTAPGFALVDQDGDRVTLAQLRGKVVAVTFGYSACPDICPRLTDKLVRVQDALGGDFGNRFKFVFITLDPEHDTPAQLKDYARAWNARPDGWWFLTGSPAEIAEVTRGYGVFARKSAPGVVDHTQLTSLVDGTGRIRVQYVGERFDPEEFRRDLLSLAHGP